MPASRSSRRLLAALASLGPALGFAQTLGFTEAFAPGNWSFTSGGSPASVAWDETFTSFTLGGSDDGSGSPGYTLFTVNLSDAYRVSFDWSYSTADGAPFDFAGYTSGSFSQLSDNGGWSTQSGSTAAPVYFGVGASGFYVYSTDNTYGAASLTISNFSFSLAAPGDTGAPPPISWPSAHGPDTDVTIDNGSNVVLSGDGGQARSIYLANSSFLTVEAGGVLTLADSDNSYFAADYGAALTVTGAGSSFQNAGYATFYTASALFDQGAAVVTHGATLGFAEDNVATLDLRNGATWNAGDVTVGFGGQATINIESGAALTAGDLTIGYGQTSRGTLNISGSGSTLATAFLKVGDFGVGALNVSGGAHVSSTSASIAYGSIAGPGLTVGTVHVTGAGSRWTIAAEDLGLGAYIDDTLYSVGTLTIADGGLVKVGPTGAGTVNIDRGGTVEIGSGALAGTLQAGAVSFVATSGAAALLAFDHTDDVAFSTPISGRGRVIKAGSGTLTLSGNNAYTQGTTVAGGTLRATSGANALGSGPLALAGGDLALANNTGLNFGLNTSLSADATVTSDRLTTNGAGVTHTLGTLALGARTLSLAAGSRVTSGTAGLTFGATTLSADGAVFDTGAGTRLTLGALSGDFAFIKQGAGQLTLGSSSSRGGATTTLSAGTLRLANANALGTAQRTFNLDGGNLQLAANSASTFNGTNVVLRGDATLTSDRGTTSGAGVTHTLGTLSAGGHTLSTARGSLATSGTGGLAFGAVTLTGAPTFSVGSNTQLTLGPIGDGGNARGFTKTGAGTLGIPADNTFTGSVTVSAGTLQIGNNNSSGTLGSAVSGAGALTKSGSGTLTLSGNNNYTGATTVSAGILVLTRDNALGTAATGTTVSSGAILALQGGFSYATAESLTLSTGTGGGLSNLSGTNSFAGPIILSGVSRYLVAGGSQLTLTGQISGSPATSLRNGGTLVLANSGNSFSGALTVNDGTLVATANGALGNTAGQINVNSGGTLAFSGGVAYTSAKPVTLIGTGASGRNGALDNLSGDNSFAGSISLSDPIARIGAAAGSSLTLSGVISAAIAGWGPTYAGPGLVKVTGDNTYSGATVLAGGTLEFSTLANLGAGTAITFDGGALRYAAGAATDISSRTVTLQSGGATIDTQGNDVAFASTIGNNGAGALTKTGAGTLTLSAANTYSGGTFVNGGTLAAGHASAFGSGPIVVNLGATLDLGGFSIANTLDVRGGALSGLASYSGTQTVAGNTTYTGVVGGALVVASGGAINTTGATFTGPVTVQSGGALTGTGTVASVVIAGGGTLSPGNSPGLLTIDGDLTLSSGSFATFEIAGLARGVAGGYDAVDISGAFTAGGTLDVVFIDGYTPSGPATFDLFDFSSFGGSFAQVNLPVIGGYTWNTSQLSIDGTLSLVVSAIPEPSASAALAGAALLGLGLTARRRRPR